MRRRLPGWGSCSQWMIFVDGVKATYLYSKVVWGGRWRVISWWDSVVGLSGKGGSAPQLPRWGVEPVRWGGEGQMWVEGVCRRSVTFVVLDCVDAMFDGEMQGDGCVSQVKEIK